MTNRKIEAIRYLQECFKADPKYKKDWTDYIELCVTEELETQKIKLKDLQKLRTNIASHIIRVMFDADWWESQQ